MNSSTNRPLQVAGSGDEAVIEEGEIVIEGGRGIAQAGDEALLSQTNAQSTSKCAGGKDKVSAKGCK